MNKLFTKIAGLSIGLAMAICVGVAVGSNSQEAKSVSAATTKAISSFSGTSGSIDTNINYACAKGDGTTAPAYGSNYLRVYKPASGKTTGGYISVTAATGYKISSVSFTGSGDRATSVATKVDSGAISSSESFAKSGTKTVSGVTATTVSLYNVGSDRLSIGTISVTYDSSGSTTYTVTIEVNNSDYGSVNKSSVASIASGTSISASGNVLTVGTNTVTATATTSTPQFTYAFSSWSGIPAGGTVTSSFTVTANFTKTANPVSSLAITGSMAKTTYTQGEAWDPTGFTVNAYYSSAPSTPVDVTSSVEWSYNPETTASTSTKSVTCTASFGGQTATSSAQSVTINEKTNLGGIVDGEKYFIISTYNSTEYYLKSFSSTAAVYDNAAEWPGDNNMPAADTDAWTFSATSTDDCWSVTNNSGDTLYSIADNNGLRSGTSEHVWQLAMVSNGLRMYNTAHSGEKGMYLTIFQGTNWRTYNATGTQGDACSTIRFVKYEAPATIESVEFTGDMTKKAYYVGDSWDYSGLSLQANLSDETTENLGTVASLIQSGDLEIEATPASPALNITSVSLLAYYGTDLLEAEAEITGITVSTPRTLESVTLDGDMTNKTYAEGNPWDVTGLYLTLSYNVGLPDTIQLVTLTKDTDYIFDHDTAVVGDTQIEITGGYDSFEFDKTITGIVVNALPGVINFGNTTGYWAPTESGSTFVDSKNNTATITSDSTSWNTRGSNYQQVGSNNSAASYVLVSIPLSQKAGIDAVSVTFSSSGANSVSLKVYGDTVDDVIVTGSAPGSTNVTVSTGQEYTKINATALHFAFEPTKGVKLTSISYTLGSTVQDFGTLASIEISSSSLHSTLFEVNQTFSTEGLVITATDTVGFKKDFTTGFTTDYDGVTFVETAEDLEVIVTMTIGQVTKTASYYIDVVEIPSYTLATSQSELYEGMIVLIAYVEDTSVYTAGSLSGAYLSEVDGSMDGSDIRAGDGTYEFVVEYYGSNILLRHGANYLKHTGDKNVSLVSQIDASCVWSYDGASLNNVENNTYYLQYNKSSPRFTDYTGSQQNVGLYISSATPKDDTMGAATFAQKYLHMRDYTDADGSCKNDSKNHYYSTAKTAYGSLTTQEKTEFAGLTDAVARLQAWARANGETFDPSAKTFSAINGRVVLSAVTKNSGTIIAIITISAVSLAAIGGYFLFRKKKEN